MARRSKRTPPLRVGLVGSGKLAKKAIKQHLSDFIEAQDGPVTWYFPLEEDTPKALSDAVDELFTQEATYVLVTDGTSDDDLEEHAESIVEVESAQSGVISELVTAPGESKTLIILLDEDTEGDLDLLEHAAEEKLKTLDLCHGLQEIELEDASEEEPEEEEEEDDADEDGPELPAKVQKAIDKGDRDKAIDELKKLDREEILEFAEALEFDPEEFKGKHAKTIAASVVDYILSGLEGDEPEDEPEDEDVPEEEEEAPAPKRGRGRKASAAAEPEDEPEEAEPEPEAEDAAAMTRSAPMSVHPSDVLHVLASITNAHDLKTAKDFHKFAKEQGLL